MQLTMMTTAEGYSELVADFEAECPGVRKPQVMRIGRLPAADEARLRGNEPQMGLVTQSLVQRVSGPSPPMIREFLSTA